MLAFEHVGVADLALSNLASATFVLAMCARAFWLRLFGVGDVERELGEPADALGRTRGATVLDPTC